VELTLREKLLVRHVAAIMVLGRHSRFVWHTLDARRDILLVKSSLILGRLHARTDNDNRVGMAAFDRRLDAPEFIMARSFPHQRTV
jgi:hypothetical protein